MTTIILTIHLFLALGLVCAVLLQRSEGGALGIGGGGGGGGGLMTGRAQANLLTRLTAGLAVAFMSTSLLLAILAGQERQPDEGFQGCIVGRCHESAHLGWRRDAHLLTDSPGRLHRVSWVADEQLPPHGLVEYRMEDLVISLDRPGR